MKEDLRQLWSQKTKTQAAHFLADWIARAEGPGIGMLQEVCQDLANPLGRHIGLL